jgi:tape measure domain-containing protein
LIESSQRLLAFGFDAQKIIPILTSVGDAVAGFRWLPEKLNRVLLALGQIRAKGKVAAGEMLQLTEAGIPAWEMLAKKIGVSIPEAMKLSERGAIDAETAINAVIEGMNKKFGGLMAKQALSWSGMLSNIKDTFTQVTGRVMRPFFELGLKEWINFSICLILLCLKPLFKK